MNEMRDLNYSEISLVKKIMYDDNLPVKIVKGELVFSPIHLHDDVELIYVKKGRVKVKISFNCYELEAEDFLLINPHEVHNIEKTEAENEIIFLHIQKEMFKEYLFVFHFEFYRNFNSEKVSEVKNIMERLYEAHRKHSLHFYDSDPSDPSDFRSHVMTLTKHLTNICDEYFQMQNFDVNSKKLSTCYNHEINSQRIKTVCEYMYMRNLTNKRLTELAEIEHIDKFYASRLIKDAMGKGFQETVGIVRVDRAEVLLLGTNWSVQKISEEVGFSGINSFTRIFKQYFGYTPGVYRKTFKSITYPHSSEIIRETSKASICDEDKNIIRELMLKLEKLEERVIVLEAELGKNSENK